MSNELASTLPVQYSLTSDMQLGLKSVAPKSVSRRVSISPSNKSIFVPQDTIIFDIPTGRPGTWLDQSQTYIKFSAQFLTTATTNVSASAYISSSGGGVHLDNSAYSFFQRLDVFNGSNPLESINQYGQLCNYLIDTQLSMSDKAGLSGMIGTNPYGVISAGTSAPAANSKIVQVQYPGDRTGLSVTALSSSTSTISQSPAYHFALPILSGVVGVNASKMIPLKDLTAPINLQFTLSQNDDAVVYGVTATGVTWQLVSVELVCCFVEIDDDRFNVSDKNVPQYISSKSYRQVSTTIPAGTLGQMDILVPIRAYSLTQLISRFRNQASAVQGASTCAYRLSSSVSPNLASYQWKIADKMFPQKPVYLYNGSNGTLIGSGAEAFAELSKAFHAIGSVLCNGSISHDLYNVSNVAMGNWNQANTLSNAVATANYDTAGNAFSISQELETFSNRSDTILCGINTQGGNPVILSLVIAVATVGSIVCDTFGQYDLILTIQDGQIIARW